MKTKESNNNIRNKDNKKNWKDRNGCWSIKSISPDDLDTTDTSILEIERAGSRGSLIQELESPINDAYWSIGTY